MAAASGDIRTLRPAMASVGVKMRWAKNHSYRIGVEDNILSYLCC
jgi:hypothetical protein